MRPTTVLHGDKPRGVPENPVISNWQSATKKWDSYGLFLPFRLTNLVSPALLFGAVAGNSDRILCPLDTQPRDQGNLNLIPRRNHYLYEIRHLQPYMVPSYRGRGRELK